MTFNNKNKSKDKKDEKPQDKRAKIKQPISVFSRSMQRAVNSDTALNDELSLYGVYASIGQFLYIMGFETEYYLLCLSRVIYAVSRYSYKHFKHMLIRALMFLRFVFEAITKDFLEPARQAKSGFDNIKEIIREEKVRGSKAHAAKAGLAYFGRGVHRYRHLLFNLASYLLPVGAAMIFAFTAKTMLNYTYALSVTYNGEQLGYIANENVYEEAQNQVRSRIKGTNTAKDWQAKPDFKLAVINDETLASTYTLADNLVNNSQADIMSATGIEIDGELLGVTTDGAILQTTLDNMKAQYADAENESLRVEFVKDVKLIDGLYLTSSITQSDEIVAKLTGEVEGQKIYTVAKGDSPQLIAEKNGIPLKDLQGLNPQMTEKGYNMPIGSQLIVSRSENFLQVKTIENTTYTQVIAHNTEKRESDKLFKNKTKTIQKGQDGERLINADIVRIDGVEIDRIILSDEVTIEPVDEIVEVGNKSTYSTEGSSVGSGSFAHPVPGRSYITTRFGQGGHRGLDLCAPYGTPIYACDSGTVIEAGYHGSFGNYILINHGNGMTTRYCHMSGFAVTGGTVARGQMIGYVGQTGNASGNHCHLEVTAGGRLVNPAPLIGE